jgi:hypothetical protein
MVMPKAFFTSNNTDVSLDVFILIGIFCAIFYSNKLVAVEIAGSSEFEVTAYAENGQFENQDYRYNSSLALSPEFFWEWNSGDSTLVVTPFVRVDARDDERSHTDIREFDFTYVKDTWELHAGIRKVFWGVTEFNHLVDVINQTDGVESLDGEAKLGQPMLSMSRFTDWGIIDSYILIGFRKRTFVGQKGRLRGEFIVNKNEARFENSREEEAINYALRWSHSLAVFDVGVYWFSGIDREPIFEPSSSYSSLQLTPVYENIDQIGVDVQATVASWLFKFEGLHQSSNREEYLASQLGFEYTVYGLANSVTDVGLLLEYGWDERGINGKAIAQNDIYIGTRLALNDAAGSTLLMSASYDVDFHTKNILIEASRRLNDRWTITIEGSIVEGDNSKDPVAALNNDDRLQLSVQRFF